MGGNVAAVAAGGQWGIGRRWVTVGGLWASCKGMLGPWFLRCQRVACCQSQVGESALALTFFSVYGVAVVGERPEGGCPDSPGGASTRYEKNKHCIRPISWKGDGMLCQCTISRTLSGTNIRQSKLTIRRYTYHASKHCEKLEIN